MRGVVYCVWDWFEAITQDQTYDLKGQVRQLQHLFRRSVYGGPTVYSLLRTAYEKGIPSFYLWDEGLVQYGYGKKQVRGSATTFDCDSHLDSDFTTYKDDCKAFLSRLGFPVPKGEVITSYEQARTMVSRIGYPVVVKPVVGHKGMGVTTNVQDDEQLRLAFERAAAAVEATQPLRVIVERSITGSDFRLLCVNGRFVAAMERRPATVTGNGHSTLIELIERENQTPARRDTPTSPLSKIQLDDALNHYLEEQGLTLDSVIEPERTVYLRKVANLSAGGVGIDATQTLHPENIILAQDIAQHFRLTCLGIDVIAQSLDQSWKKGNFGILEINAAPGISMHLQPAVGESVNVPAHILETFFESGAEARIPIITFNNISVRDLQEVIDHILFEDPNWVIGAVCQEAVLVNRSEKSLHPDYNTNVQNLLRNPKLDLLIAEYQDPVLEREGIFYHNSDIVILDNPTETELILARDLLEHGTMVLRQGNTISIRSEGLIGQYELGPEEPFQRVYLKEIAKLL